MPFVKLDCGILNSTLWIDRLAREVFITALLMAEPREITEPMAQIAVASLDLTGWSVPVGWYGFVPAAGSGILHRARVDEGEIGMAALARLSEPDPESRSATFDGRRMVRVNGGFIVLNYIAYREKDATTADRSKRWRERQKLKALQHDSPQPTRVSDTPTRVIRHQAEVEVEVEAEAEIPVTNNKLVRKTVAVTKANSNGHNSRSKHPIFSGQRFVVFDWMLEDIGRTLGSHLDAFDVHEWFFSLDAKAVKDSIVKAKNDWWPWIQQELLTEAQKRGLPTSEPKQFGATPKTAGNAAALKRFAERKTS